MARYRKLIVMVLTLVVFALKEFTGIGVPEGTVEKGISMLDVLIGVGATIGVWAVPNKP